MNISRSNFIQFWQLFKRHGGIHEFGFQLPVNRGRGLLDAILLCNLIRTELHDDELDLEFIHLPGYRAGLPLLMVLTVKLIHRRAAPPLLPHRRLRRRDAILGRAQSGGRHHRNRTLAAGTDST